MIPVRMTASTSTFHVELYVYDLSHGMASQFAPMLGLDFPLDGIWHTAVVVHGLEWFFGGGGGIMNTHPGTTELGQPLRKVDLGRTSLNRDQYQEFLGRIGSDRFAGHRYHLFDNNCNNFSEVVSRHLTGNGIPQYILDLPNMVKNSPVAKMIAPIIEQATPNSGESVGSGGGSRESSYAASEERNKCYNNFPCTNLIRYSQKMDKDKAEGKLRELNDKNSDIAKADIKGLLKLVDDPKSLNMSAWRLICPLFESWPRSDLFPVLDVLRHVTGAEDIDSEIAKEMLANIYSILSPSANTTCVQLSLKIACNLFQAHSDPLLTKYREVVMAKINSILEEADELPANLQVTLSSVVLNYAVVFLNNPDPEASVQIVSSLVSAYLGRLNAPEGLYRSVVALGTLVMKDAESRDLALALDATSALKMIKSGMSEKLDECISECKDALDG